MYDLLLEHNIPVFHRLESAMEESHSVLLQTATGTGKTYLASQFCLNSTETWLCITPRNSLEDMWNGMAKKYHIRLHALTYQALSRKDEDALMKLAEKYDGFIFDEAHHIAAPTWQTFSRILTSFGKPVLGLTADSTRYSDGVDVAGEFFQTCIRGYSLGEAISKGILPSFQYIKAFFSVPHFDGTPEPARKEIFDSLLSKLTFSIENQYSVLQIMKKHMDGGKHKMIIFVENIADFAAARECIEKIIPKENIFVMSHKQRKKLNLASLEMFTKAEDSAAIINVNILTEGIHVDGADILVMFRRTESPNIFFQQIGRIVSPSSLGKNLLVFDFVGNYQSVRIPHDGKTKDAIAALNTEIKDEEKQVIVSDYCQEALCVIREIEDILGLNWLSEEDDILRNFYPLEGMEVSVRLPGRSRTACKARALKLGLHVLSKEWTEQENNILKEFYPVEGRNVCKRLSNRSAEACKAQANKLGLFSRRWSEEDLRILSEYYLSEGQAVCKRIPLHSPASCVAKANSLGLMSNRWTDEELEILREKYPLVGSGITKYLPQYSLRACYSQAQKMGLRTFANRWSQEQIDLLYQLYPDTDTKTVAARIGKSVACCASKASKLGIRKK